MHSRVWCGESVLRISKTRRRCSRVGGVAWRDEVGRELCMGACPLPRHDVEYEEKYEEGIHRVIRAPRRMPMKMAIDVGKGLFLLAGCMAVGGFKRVRKIASSVLLLQSARLAQQTTHHPSSYLSPSPPIPGHPFCSHVSPEDGPLSLDAAADCQKFSSHCSADTWHTTLRGPLVGRQTALSPESTHPWLAKSHMAHPHPLPFHTIFHSSHPPHT